jgi:hypothetical protein
MWKMSRAKDWTSRHPWWTINLSLTVMLILVALFGHPAFDVGNFATDKQTTAALISEFHDELNDGRFDDIYQNSSQVFRRSVASSEVTNRLRQNKERFGSFKNVLSSESTVLHGPPVEVRAVYNAAFDKGIVTELFRYVKEGRKLKLAFYEIRPGTGNLSFIEDRLIAEEAANEFYSRLSHEEYEAIFESMSDDLRATTSKEQVTDHFREINEKLGSCAAPVLTDADYAEDNGSHFVGLKFARACEVGEVNERLAFKIVDGKAMLRGYH